MSDFLGANSGFNFNLLNGAEEAKEEEQATPPTIADPVTTSSKEEDVTVPPPEEEKSNPVTAAAPEQVTTAAPVTAFSGNIGVSESKDYEDEDEDEDERPVAMPNPPPIANIGVSESKEADTAFNMSNAESKARLAGLYPDTHDEEDFIRRLLEKQEFAESYQEPLVFDPDNPLATVEEGVEKDFEATPVQRFVANFMSPHTPYRSILLYHSVGVGKTCAAVTTAERYLSVFPRREVFIVAPPRIQDGFKSTIFDVSKVKIAGGRDEPSHASQCTGDTYLRLTSSFFEKKATTIEARVAEARNKRYKFFGYGSLKNYIAALLERVKDLPAALREKEERSILRREFSGRLLIIDEAHNLNDLPGAAAAEDNLDTPAGDDEAGQQKEGKQLTPYLLKVLRAAEGLKLMLLTGTPMYNSYREIIFMLKILLINDGKRPISEDEVFTKEGTFVLGGEPQEDGSVSRSGEEVLGEVASKYVSFMRGENPRSFPLRLSPEGMPRITEYPRLNVTGREPVGRQQTAFASMLPIVPSPLTGSAQGVLKRLQDLNMGVKGGANPIIIESLVQYGNIVYPDLDPNTAEQDPATLSKDDLMKRVGEAGLTNTFQVIKEGASRVYMHQDVEGSDWMSYDNLGEYSPKMKTVLGSLLNAEGVCFVYSRFVGSGALPLALILEANGYSPFGRARRLLGNGWRHPEGRVCAYCTRRERVHGPGGHAEGVPDMFVPATYGLLTGNKLLTPYFKDIVEGCQDPGNVDGGKLKVILGSQIAAEGIDLRYIRESHILDSWFHLNKTEQVIGRAIRFRSHIKLPPAKRNTTVMLHVNLFDPAVTKKETPDLYCYRLAYSKATQVGRVTRVLKSYALDCNLNHNMVYFKDLPRVDVIDSQRRERRGVSIDDMPFSPLCDWLEKCDFKCHPEIKVQTHGADDTTYSPYAAQWRNAQMHEVVRALFKQREMPFISSDEFLRNPYFEQLPRSLVTELLNSILGNKSFVLTCRGKRGYLIYNNGYIVFQPLELRDKGIPLALRTAFFPVKRDSFEPALLVSPVTALGPASGASASGASASAAAAKPTVRGRPVDNLAVTQLGWNACLAWVDALREDFDADLPDELKDEYLQIYTGKDKREVDLFMEKADTIRWFGAHLSRYLGEESSDIYYQVVLEYLYDEWFREESKATHWQQFEGVSEDILAEHIIKEGNITAYRFLDPSDGQMKYYCEGKACPTAVRDRLVVSRADRLRGLQLNKQTTGDIYGFLTYKSGSMIFKTSEPPAAGAKPAKGSECGIITTTKTHRDKMERLGAMLEAELGTNFDLTSRGGVLSKDGDDTVRNVNKVCTLFDLLLRWMDKAQVGDKRWFYRSVSANITGHGGTKTKVA
jgi:hypothetical protein